MSNPTPAPPGRGERRRKIWGSDVCVGVCVCVVRTVVNKFG